MLDEHGKLEAVLCPGYVKLIEIKSLSASVKLPRANIPVVKPAPVNPKNPIAPINMRVDEKPPSALPDFTLPYTIFLGDISGSMGGSNMVALHKGLDEVIKRYSAKGVPYAVCAWDGWIEWPSTGRRWLKASDRDATLSWAQRLQARGGNDMRYAIEEAAKKGDLRDSAKHLMVMCDGDIRPFTVRQEGKNTDFSRFIPKAPEARTEGAKDADDWEAFFRSLPKNIKSVHFVAFGDGAQKAEMQQMASIARGHFYQFG